MGKTITVKIKKLKAFTTNSQIPFYASSGAAGADLYAYLEKDLVIKPGERVKVPTGIAIELPGPEVVALIFARSGLSLKGLALSNGVGVIDSDYRGEIIVPMTNFSQEEITIKNGDRIAQMLITGVYRASFVEVTELTSTARNQSGFGSTGL
ncbi:MAG: dUTP diphosphatase [Peptococcaceae bacterium]|nr:dUTP diphosphatase [Peptococcaceae bacterium]